jgi:hypothetical protein
MSENLDDQLFLTGVGVMRDSFDVARHHYDIIVDGEGVTGYFIWRRNSFRIPLISPLFDLLKRRGRNSSSRDEAINSNDLNFFIPFSEIQGVVTHDEHKEIQILSSQEQLIILFRPIKDYEAFVESISEHIENKVFNRDMTETIDSVYIS